MTNVPAPAPGWYPDPQRPGGLRWWDGMRWTEHVSAAPPSGYAPSPYASSPYAPSPYAPVRRRPLPDGTPLYTVWIWLIVFLPLVSALLLFLLRPQPAFRLDETGSRIQLSDPTALLGGPLYFVVIGIGWLVFAATIVFAWLDYRELAGRGVERPFHWAWSFFGIVYPIGRSVIVRGIAGGRGLAPLWVSIAVNVVSVAIALIWSVLLVAQILGTAANTVPLGT